MKHGLAAALELGSLVGALASGVLADRYSRRQSISTACGALVSILRSFRGYECAVIKLSSAWDSQLRTELQV